MFARRAFNQQLQINDQKSNFVSSVSHELRAPIASVRLMAENLEREKISEPHKQREYFAFIVQECRRLSSLIENVLDFSRIEQGCKTYRMQPTRLGDIVRVVARMMATFNVHSVYVFEHQDEDDENPQLWAVVSDLDLVAASRLDLDQRTAGGSAVTPLVTVPRDAPIQEAAELMAQHGIAHLAVIDPDARRPIGVISTLDIARAVAAGLGPRETFPSG